LLEVIEPLLSVPQAAKILGISQCTLRNWIQRKKIARVKVGAA
jgi:excisionase family DNA binding protein